MICGHWDERFQRIFSSNFHTQPDLGHTGCSRGSYRWFLLKFPRVLSPKRVLNGELRECIYDSWEFSKHQWWKVFWTFVGCNSFGFFFFILSALRPLPTIMNNSTRPPCVKTKKKQETDGQVFFFFFLLYFLLPCYTLPAHCHMKSKQKMHVAEYSDKKGIHSSYDFIMNQLVIHHSFTVIFTSHFVKVGLH